MLHKLQWRYATKKFDTTREIEEEHITQLLKAMNLSASSYGLQPYTFVVVKNDELQQKLQDAAYGQAQVTEASHVVVIAAKTEINDEYIDSYIKNIAETRNQSIDELTGYADMMKNGIGSQEHSEQLTWSQRQCYIPLGTLLFAAADMKIDACPMEGFDADAFDELLELKEDGLHATVMITLGYRSVDDKYQHEKKVRKELTDIVSLRYV